MSISAASPTKKNRILHVTAARDLYGHEGTVRQNQSITIGELSLDLIANCRPDLFDGRLRLMTNECWRLVPISRGDSHTSRKQRREGYGASPQIGCPSVSISTSRRPTWSGWPTSPSFSIRSISRAALL